MKKYFMLVAVAAAGMLASCSSESLTAGSDPKIEPTQEDRVPIEINVASSSVRATTRGTGTVGGVGVAETDASNVWQGQRINVFMFTKDADKKTTLDLTKENGVAFYDGVEMITPGTVDNKIPGQSTATNSGEAMIWDGTIQYYPPTGNFDFFGYHGDDAITGAVDKTTAATTLWTVPFTIDGSQDLMSTKAALTGTQSTTMAGSKDYYSAKAARKSVQPVLSFDHLLTRLSFVIIPGNDNAGGWSGSQDPDKAVYVKSIKVYSKTTGNMAVAWTADDPGDLITWTGGGSPEWLSLKDRPNYYNKVDKTITLTTASFNSLPVTYAFYFKTADPSDRISEAQYAALTPGEQGAYDDKYDDDYYFLKATPNDASKRITDTEWAALPAADPGTGADWQGNYTKGYYQSDFNAITATPTNYNLAVLTPTYPKMTESTTSNPNQTTSVGEALIVAPSAEDYDMEVTLTQKVPTDWDDPTALTEKSQTYPLKIKAPTNGFEKNTSYQVKLTVYGFERIVVTTKIIPWVLDTTPIEVGQDE